MENRIQDIKTKHHHESGVYAREMELPKGWFAESHSHEFSHMSILAKGKAIVTVDGVDTEYKAPLVVNIEAGKVHKIVAIEDTVWFCIHSTDKLDEETLKFINIEEL